MVPQRYTADDGDDAAIVDDDASELDNALDNDTRFGKFGAKFTKV
jgi:hypothetical protein